MLEEYWPASNAVLKKAKEQLTQEEIDAGRPIPNYGTRLEETYKELSRQNKGIIISTNFSSWIVQIFIGIIIGIVISSWSLGWPQTQKTHQTITIVGILLIILIIISTGSYSLLKKRLNQ
jgi:hypothetical protein